VSRNNNLFKLQSKAERSLPTSGSRGIKSCLRYLEDPQPIAARDDPFFVHSERKSSLTILISETGLVVPNLGFCVRVVVAGFAPMIGQNPH